MLGLPWPVMSVSKVAQLKWMKFTYAAELVGLLLRATLRILRHLYPRHGDLQVTSETNVLQVGECPRRGF